MCVRACVSLVPCIMEKTMQLQQIFKSCNNCCSSWHLLYFFHKCKCSSCQIAAGRAVHAHTTLTHYHTPPQITAPHRAHVLVCMCRRYRAVGSTVGTLSDTHRATAVAPVVPPVAASGEDMSSRWQDGEPLPRPLWVRRPDSGPPTPSTLTSQVVDVQICRLS